MRETRSRGFAVTRSRGVPLHSETAQPRNRETTPRPDFREHLLRGIELFNERKFWHAHEAWETIWLVAHSEVKRFLQGLIQLAAAWHHVQRGTTAGAPRLFSAALRKLAGFPPGYCGVDRRAAETAARDGGRTYPELSLLSTENDVKPPCDDW